MHGQLLRVWLASGEGEVRLTTLCDARAYPAPEFKTVYGEGWGEATYFDRYKNIFKVERYSGTSVAAVEQAVYGVFFLMTLESRLTQPAQAALAQQGADRHTKFVPQVNRAARYLALLARVVVLLLSLPSAAQVLAELPHLFGQHPTLLRPGRQFIRRLGLNSMLLANRVGYRRNDDYIEYYYRSLH